MHPEVIDEMLPFMRYSYGNPGALYMPGIRAREAVDEARSKVAVLFGCAPENVIFTSGGSEGNNLVVKGLIPYMEAVGRQCYVVSAVEHDSVLHAVRDARKIKPVFYSKFLQPTEDGRIDAAALQEAVDASTGLASVMYVNNETGAFNDIGWFGRLCHDKGALFHADCVQAAGTFPLDSIRENCDFMTVSAHKIHGPKGVGAVYAADPNILTPLISGGSHQEFGLRGGTENVPGIVGFGKACELAVKSLEKDAELVRDLKVAFFDALRSELVRRDLYDFVSVNGLPAAGRGKILSLCFRGVDAQSMLLALNAFNIFCSAGSACTSHENEPSHVLKAMGMSDEDARSSLRFSFMASLRRDDVENAAKTVATVYWMLKGGIHGK